jgi:ATP-binding cassette subfamily B protein
MLFRRKYPLVRQYDQLDCGPAALLSVLRFYRGDTTLVHARQLCRTDLQGTTMLDMVHAARAMGFEARGARGSFAELTREKMPCIAHVILPEGLSHYLVIYRIAGERLRVGDPGKGRYTLNRAAFEELWQQHAAILLEPAGNGVHPSGRLTRTEKKSPPAGLLQAPSPGWLSWIGTYLRQQRTWLQQILFTGILYTAAGLLTALFVQTLIDRLIPHKERENLLFIAVALMLLLALRAAIGYIRDRLLIVANKRLSLEVTGDFFIHLFRLPKSFFDSRKTGDITARINDSLRIHRTCLLLLQSALLDLFLVLGSLLFMFHFSPRLGVLTLTMLPVYTAVLWWQSRRLKRQQAEVMKSHAVVESTYIDSIQGMPEIMTYGAAPAFTGLNQSLFGYFQGHIERLGLMQAGLTLAVGLLGAFISVMLLAVGAWHVIGGELALGQFMAAYSLLSYILPAVTGLVAGYVEFQGAEVAAQRLMDLLLVEMEEGMEPDGQSGEASPVQTPPVLSTAALPRLEVEGLTFAWPKRPPLLQELSLTIPAGRITGLWGPSGSGKSTLVQLLQRKYIPLCGTIRLEGMPIDRLALAEVRRSIGVVPQQIKIFNATLAENLLLGRPAATLDEIAIRLDELGLQALPGRFDRGLLTLLGEEGRKLSGGEAQLLALARALYSRPQVLIIDEGLSAIDVDLENMLAERIGQWAQRHAVLLITHNLESLRRTEYLYLLRAGRIAEEGNPQELVAGGGLFQTLMQMKNRMSFATIGGAAC